jgi:hypothetical protein
MMKGHKKPAIVVLDTVNDYDSSFKNDKSDHTIQSINNTLHLRNFCDFKNTSTQHTNRSITETQYIPDSDDERTTIQTVVEER